MMSEGLWALHSQLCSLTCLHPEGAGLHIHAMTACCLHGFFRFFGELISALGPLVKTD